jgi:hypothetical protein
MATGINILPQPNRDKNLRGHIIVHLTDPLSYSGRKGKGIKSGFVRISSVKRLQREDEKLRKDYNFWMSKFPKINEVGNELQQLEIASAEFDNVADCLEHIGKCGNKCVILVLSHYHSQNRKTVSSFKKFPQIVLLYRCVSEIHIKKLQERWHAEDRFFVRNILPSSMIGTQIKNLDESDQLLLMEIFLINLIVNLPRDDKAKSDFLKYCRSRYEHNLVYMEKIKHFEGKYNEENAIKWYTNPNSFVFGIVGETCACFNFSTFFEIRSILRDIYVQLQKLHEQQIQERFQNDLVVYRGIMMSKDELNRLKTIGDIFITRNFLSTSLDKNVAVIYSGDGVRKDDEVSVLISMVIDRIEMQDKPIAFIGDHSNVQDENEVVLPMGIVFCIDGYEEIQNDSTYQVKIKMVRGEKERKVEGDLIQFYLLGLTGASCPFLGMAAFLASIHNGQYVGEYCKLMCHALKSSNPQLAEHLSTMSNGNVQHALVS